MNRPYRLFTFHPIASFSCQKGGAGGGAIFHDKAKKY